MDVAELSMLLETIQCDDVSPEDFQKAVISSNRLKDLDSDQKLILYGLFKQSTVGDVNIPKPELGEIATAAKWYNNTKLAAKIDINTLFKGICGTISKDFL